MPPPSTWSKADGPASGYRLRSGHGGIFRRRLPLAPGAGMRDDWETPPLTHRQPPRDYVPTGKRAPRAPLTCEQIILLALLCLIAGGGCMLIWLGIR